MECPGPFGPYELLRTIAVGGMGEVYLAKMPGMRGFEKRLALKLIRPGIASDPQFINMLAEEAKLAVRLDHDNIVQVFDLGAEEGRYYIAMEYIDGLDLARLIQAVVRRGQHVPVEVAVHVLAGVCAGTSYAHRSKGDDGAPLGIVHRDLSPHNVLAGFHGAIKIADFGIAKARLRLRTTMKGVIKGKLRYLSPEQANADPIDWRTDIFGIGTIGYELLTGRHMYARSPSVGQAIEVAKEVRITPPREIRPDIPDEIEALLLRALAREPSERYPTADDMRVELARWLHDHAPRGFGRRDFEHFMDSFKPSVTDTVDMLSRQEFVIDADRSVIFNANSVIATRVFPDAEFSAEASPTDAITTAVLGDAPDDIDSFESAHTHRRPQALAPAPQEAVEEPVDPLEDAPTNFWVKPAHDPSPPDEPLGPPPLGPPPLGPPPPAALRPHVTPLGQPPETPSPGAEPTVLLEEPPASARDVSNGVYALVALALLLMGIALALVVGLLRTG